MEFDFKDVRKLVDEFNPDVPTGDVWLDMRYESQVARFGQPNPYWRLFYRLCKELEPDVAVELGAWQGTCAAHMAAGYPMGQVVTFDHHTDPGDDVNERLSREAMHRYTNMVYVKGWTWDKAYLLAGTPIDILFIDSWHQYDKAWKDWDTFRPLLADEALVVCDDILSTDGPVIAGMWKFWEEISDGRESFLSLTAHPGFPMGFMKYIREAISG